MTQTADTAAAWGWRPIIDRMDADHCRRMLAMGKPALATLGWSDADIRQMERVAAR